MFQRKRQKEDASEPNQSGFIVDEEGPCVVSKMDVFLGASTSMATIWNFFNRGKRELVPTAHVWDRSPFLV